MLAAANQSSLGVGQLFTSESVPPGTLRESSSGSPQTLLGCLSDTDPSVMECAARLPAAHLQLPLPQPGALSPRLRTPASPNL